ncbi:MAG: hypothetical protein AAF567_23820 [Actinomycetota bacterium]
MDLGEIDARLQRYTAAEHRIGSNLLELEDHTVFRLLTTGALQGRTAQALGAVTDADPSLWDLFSLLGRTLDRARTMRGSGRLGGAERRDLGQLLTGASILVRSEDVPLNERDLTGDASNEERMSIDALLDRMRETYEPVREAIARTDAVLDGLLPRLSAADRTLQHLRDEVRALGLDDRALTDITSTIERIRDLSLTDPLAIPPDASTALDAALADATTTIGAARAQHDSIAADFAAAEQLVDRCRTLIETSTQERRRAAHKVVLAAALPMPPNPNAVDGPRGLASALQDVAEVKGTWQHQRAQLDAWRRRAERLDRQLSAVAARIHAPLERRAELRGRLKAFRAKMSGIGRSEEQALRELSDEIHGELYTAPSDLDRAERLLGQFGELLAAPA